MFVLIHGQQQNKFGLLNYLTVNHDPCLWQQAQNALDENIFPNY